MLAATAHSPAAVADARLQLLFPTPVIVHDWSDCEELNRRLRRTVDERRQTTEGVVKTNRGGWQSDTDLQDWGDPATQQLVQRILALAREYAARQAGRDDADFASGWRVRAWANVNEHGHFNRSHDHLGRQSFFSGVYYVEVGDIETGQVSGGRTRLEDWTRVAIDVNRDADALRRDVFVMPRNGRMLMFPASLMHSVEPYQGNAQRMTIAFNLYHPAWDVPRLDSRLDESDWWWTNFRGLVLLKRKLPEKLHAAATWPRHFLRESIPGVSPLRRARIAWGHATAAASELFEARRGA